METSCCLSLTSWQQHLNSLGNYIMQWSESRTPGFFFPNPGVWSLSYKKGIWLILSPLNVLALGMCLPYMLSTYVCIANNSMWNHSLSCRKNSLGPFALALRHDFALIWQKQPQTVLAPLWSVFWWCSCVCSRCFHASLKLCSCFILLLARGMTVEIVCHFPALNRLSSSAKWAWVDQEREPPHVRLVPLWLKKKPNKKNQTPKRLPPKNPTTLKMAKILALNYSS